MFSTDPSIEANGFIPLLDDQHLQDAENITPAIRTEKLNDEVRRLLDAVSARLSSDIVDRARPEGRDRRAGCGRRRDGVPRRERPPLIGHLNRLQRWAACPLLSDLPRGTEAASHLSMLMILVATSSAEASLGRWRFRALMFVSGGGQAESSAQADLRVKFDPMRARQLDKPHALCRALIQDGKCHRRLPLPGECLTGSSRLLGRKCGRSSCA